MNMEFDVRVWRGYYDQVNILGQYLKDSRPDHDGNPPKFSITLEERQKVEDEVLELTTMSDDYLNKCNMHPFEPKWIYNPRNGTTCSGSEKFLFHHLMPKRRFIRLPTFL